MSNYTDFLKPAALLFDGVVGRVFRASYLLIQNGTNASTLKCTFNNINNGDVVPTTDNVAKDATTGQFTLNAAGTYLYIESTTFSGNLRLVFGTPHYLKIGENVYPYVRRDDTRIRIRFQNPSTGDFYDITSLVDVGDIYIDVFYITDA